MAGKTEENALSIAGNCASIEVICSFLLGIFKEHGIAELDPSVFNNIEKEEKVKWYKKYNVSMVQYLRRSMLNYVGKSLNDLLRLV